MQYKRVIMFFLIALPVTAVLRLIQLRYIIDTKTGFFVQEYKTFGVAILALIFLVGLMFVVFSFTTHRSPDHPPLPNVFLSISSFISAFGILIETFFISTPNTVQTFLLKIFAILTVLFFIGFGLKRFYDFSLPKFAFLLPCIYFIFKIIHEFTVISSLAVISDNILLIAAYCSLMVFLLQFAKLYNKVDREYNFRKLLASGLVSAMFCFVQAIPYFIFNFLTSFGNMHTSIQANIGLLYMGCFVITFLTSHFSRKNACIEV